MNKEDFLVEFEDILPDGFSLQENPVSVIFPVCADSIEIAIGALQGAQVHKQLEEIGIHPIFHSEVTYTNQFGVEMDIMSEVELGSLDDMTAHDQILTAFQRFSEEYEAGLNWMRKDFKRSLCDPSISYE